MEGTLTVPTCKSITSTLLNHISRSPPTPGAQASAGISPSPGRDAHPRRGTGRLYQRRQVDALECPDGRRVRAQGRTSLAGLGRKSSV